MPTNVLTIPYPEELLLSLKKSPTEFEDEARLLLAVKLYELGRVSTGTAAQLAAMIGVVFTMTVRVRSGIGQILSQFTRPQANGRQLETAQREHERHTVHPCQLRGSAG